MSVNFVGKNWRWGVCVLLVAALIASCRCDGGNGKKTTGFAGKESRAAKKARAAITGENGKKIDYVRAVDELKKAVEDGSLDAQADLALLYFTGDGFPCADFARAFELAKEPADAGNCFAQYVVGFCYLKGLDGVEQNTPEADRYFSLAFKGLQERAKDGDARAAYYLGECYNGAEDAAIAAMQNAMAMAFGGEGSKESGFGAPRDQAMAKAWYEKAWELGYPEAGFELGEMASQDEMEEKRDYMLQAAERGSIRAACWLGAINGGQFNLGMGLGIRVNELSANDNNWNGGDYVESARWYRMAAEQNNAVAAHYLGCYYATGRGVEIDCDEALKWLKKSGELGNACAYLMLGKYYARGFGFDLNYDEALKWYRQAKEIGNEKARAEANEAIEVLENLKR